MKSINELCERFEKSVKVNRVRDELGLIRLKMSQNIWPCLDKKYLVVGCESSGTTAISHFLLVNKGARFLYEGINQWVWDLYKSVYQGNAKVRDYPRLQLYDRMKIPGFASILPEFVKEFPNSEIIYILRDPRDMVSSAFKTWSVKTKEDRERIGWAKETWLDILSSDPIERMAERWNIYLKKSLEVESVRFIRYEDFCADKVGFIRSLAKEMHLEINDEALVKYQNDQASDEDARTYAPKGPGAWKHVLSSEDANKIEAICGEYMVRWHYL